MSFDDDTVTFGQVRQDDVTAIFASIAGATNTVNNVASLTNTEFMGWDANTLSFSSYTNFQALGLGWSNFGGQSLLSVSGLNNNVEIRITDVYAGEFSQSEAVPIPLTAALLGIGVWKLARHYFGRFSAITALFFWSTDPNILAHGRLIHTDSDASTFVFLAIAWLILVLIRNPSWGVSAKA